MPNGSYTAMDGSLRQFGGPSLHGGSLRRGPIPFFALSLGWYGRYRHLLFYKGYRLYPILEIQTL
jgi:hypothetical protein